MKRRNMDLWVILQSPSSYAWPPEVQRHQTSSVEVKLEAQIQCALVPMSGRTPHGGAPFVPPEIATGQSDSAQTNPKGPSDKSMETFPICQSRCQRFRGCTLWVSAGGAAGGWPYRRS